MDSLLGILSPVTGWLLNQISKRFEEKPKLIFHFVGTRGELIPEDLRTKTSLCEYTIEIDNVGKTSVAIESLTLYYKDNLIIDCLFGDARMVAPAKKIYYQMMQQDKMELQRVYDKFLFDRCKVVANCVGDISVEGTLDVLDFGFRARTKKGFIGRNSLLCK